MGNAHFGGARRGIPVRLRGQRADTMEKTLMLRRMY